MIKEPIDESDETVDDESVESTDEQDTEQEEGTEVGVKLPEAFQKQVHGMICEMTKEQCKYVHDCLNEREAELNKEETPEPEFSAEEMPKE
jgi:hypothetical protein